jgi:hypothetical protein
VTTTFVLVASPLVGPEGWQWLAAALTARRTEVVVPELAPVDTEPPVWPAHVDRIVEQLGGLDHAVLVGHSAAGRLIPLVADRVPGADCVFLDAQLPVDLLAPGDDDWFLAHVRSIATGGHLPRWSEWWGTGAWETLVPDPMRRSALEAVLPRVSLASVEEVPPAPVSPMCAAYVRLSAAYDAEAQVCEARDWPVTRLVGGHLHFAVDEDAVADALIATADQLAD